MKTSESWLLRLELLARVDYQPVVLDFVRSVGEKFGVPGRDIQGLQVAVEEASLNVIQHAFEPGEEGRFAVSVRLEPGQIVLAVEDRGIPVDFAHLRTSDESGLGMRLMRNLTDEIRFINLGVEGKRVELVKHLPAASVEDYLTAAEMAPPEVPPAAPLDAPLSIRFLGPEEAIALARLIYRAYNYTYVEDFYYPEKVAARLESGLLRSCVVVDDNTGELVGHIGLTFPFAGARVAETGQAAVDPRYRGRDLFKTLKEHAGVWARGEGLYGFYSEAVARHPVSQKGNLKMGAHETGALVGYVPSSLQFKAIAEGRVEGRQSAILFYLKLAQDPALTVYAPPRHHAVLQRIYARSELERELAEAPPLSPTSPLPPESQLDLTVKDNVGLARMTVSAYGADFLPQLAYRLRECCQRRIEYIALWLPLCDPHTARIADEVERLGFFFGGVIPQFRNGDVLVYQYLNNVDIDADLIVTASAFGRELLDYTLADYRRASA